MEATDFILPDGQLGAEGTVLKEGDLLVITVNGAEYTAEVTFAPPVSLKLKQMIPNGNAFLTLPQPAQQLAFMLARRA